MLREARVSAEWDGITRGATLHAGHAAMRHALADAARAYDWPRALALLRENPALVNTARPDGDALFAPLHQAAHGGAPRPVVDEIVGLGAWRTLRNGRGEIPADIAARRGHRHLAEILRPVLVRPVADGDLARMQAGFHALIRERAADLVDRHALRLPELEPLREVESVRIWFAVPGMYGGFAYELRAEGEPHLLVESWSRVVGGSGQRHVIGAGGTRLVAEGFV